MSDSNTKVYCVDCIHHILSLYEDHNCDARLNNITKTPISCYAVRFNMPLCELYQEIGETKS